MTTRIIELASHAAPETDQGRKSKRADQWYYQRGNFFTAAHATDSIVCGENVDAYFTDCNGTRRLLFKLRTQVTSAAANDAAWTALEQMAKTSKNNNRGVASGRLDLNNIRTYKPNVRIAKVTDFRLFTLQADGSMSKSHIGNFAKSSIIGWCVAGFFVLCLPLCAY